MDFDSPLISVIVPCYNQAEYLSEALQSVIDQTFQNWECIIVNDGSPDNTREVAEKWCEADSRIKYVEKENGGLSDARNAGIETAKGEWIFPLDSDDKIGKDYFLLVAEKIYENPALKLIYSNASFFGIKEEKWELVQYNYTTLLRFNIIYCSAFFRKEDWRKVGGYDIKMRNGREDWEFWIRLLHSDPKNVLKLEYNGFYYRLKQDSMSSDLNNDELRIREVEMYVFEKNKELYLQTFGSYHEQLNQKVYLSLRNEALEQKLKRFKKMEGSIIYRFLKKLGFY